MAYRTDIYINIYALVNMVCIYIGFELSKSLCCVDINVVGLVYNTAKYPRSRCAAPEPHARLAPGISRA